MSFSAAIFSRKCRFCAADEVKRSRRRNFIEALLSWLLQLYPYRCEICDYRFFAFGGWEKQS
jgi:hypothetical protein